MFNLDIKQYYWGENMVSKAFSLQKGWKYEMLQDIVKLFFMYAYQKKMKLSVS